MGLSANGYYAWRGRPESQRSIPNRELTEDIRLIHAESSGCYGSPRIHAEAERRAQNSLTPSTFAGEDHASDHWTSQTGEVFQEHIENDWLKPSIPHIFDPRWIPDYMALISFLITEGHTFPEVMAKPRVNYQASLTAFAEHVGGRIENDPKAEEGRLLAHSELAIIGGWARQFGLDEPAQDAPLYRERVWREVRGILDLYGCKGLIELADYPAKA